MLLLGTRKLRGQWEVTVLCRLLEITLYFLRCPSSCLIPQISLHIPSSALVYMVALYWRSPLSLTPLFP